MVIGVKVTSIYRDSLVYALRENKKLGQCPWKIHVLNPKQVSKFKESYSNLPKNNAVDAFAFYDSFTDFISGTCVLLSSTNALRSLLPEILPFMDTLTAESPA